VTDDVAPVLGPIGSLLDQAVTYADLGFELFPASPADKTPLVSQKLATTDLDTVEAWWTKWPTALLGHRISPRHLILDVDPRHGGKDTWSALKAETGEVTTRTHYSGRGDGGGHLWFQRPAEHVTITRVDAWARARGLGAQQSERWTCGIDILRHEHRYTILPPSLHPATGRPYYWAQGRGLTMEPAAMPVGLVELLVREHESAPSTHDGFRDVDSIADWYSEQALWSALLSAHGWHVVAGDGEADGSLWRHPDASGAHSATIRNRCLFVYSPNTPFEVTYPDEPKGYTLFRAFAVLDHGGDLAAAGRAARKLRTPAGISVPGPGADTRPPRGQAARELLLTAAGTIAPQRVRWLWDGRLALGTLGLLAGPEGLGKSTIAYTLAASITRGRLPGEYEECPRAVLVCASEDSWAHTIVPRLMAADADLDLVYKLDVQLADEILVGLSLPLDVVELRHAAERVGAALLILDPLISRLDGLLDSHKDGDVRRALDPLTSIADSSGMSILGLIHHNKSGKTDPLELVMASKAFTAVARSVHTVVRDPDDETGLRRYFGTPKNNLGSVDLPTLTFTIEPWFYDTDDGQGATGRIVWGPQIRESIGDLLGRAAQDPGQRSALGEAKEWILDYLGDRDGRAPAAEILRCGRAAGHAERTLQRARAALDLLKEKAGFQGSITWALPLAPKVPNEPLSPSLGALAPLGSPGLKDAISSNGANREAPHAREAPLEIDRGPSSDLYGPDGEPWCRFGKGLGCLNGDQCLSSTHRR
jgi:hypothetical protein